jgi:hypothetical protein
MLAYVFWHWPTSGTSDKDEYERAQRRFHAGLGALSPEGFICSWSYELHGAPWLKATPQYEDWYLLEGSRALDTLNAAAVSAPVRGDHDHAAAGAAGVGGLYALRSGAPIQAAGSARWFAKPKGESYQHLYERLPADVVVWRRQMVLGPAPEFLVEGGAQLPEDIVPTVVHRRSL